MHPRRGRCLRSSQTFNSLRGTKWRGGKAPFPHKEQGGPLSLPQSTAVPRASPGGHSLTYSPGSQGSRKMRPPSRPEALLLASRSGKVQEPPPEKVPPAVGEKNPRLFQPGRPRPARQWRPRSRPRPGSPETPLTAAGGIGPSASLSSRRRLPGYLATPAPSQMRPRSS